MSVIQPYYTMNIKSLKITRHCDPGHSWGEVRMELLPKEVRRKISPYSYWKRDVLFLEEDCDLPLAVEYFQSQGVEVSFDWKHTDDDSPIRDYFHCMAK